MPSSEHVTNRGLWIESFSQPLRIVPLPFPSATTGSVVTQILASPIPSCAQLVHNGTIKLPNFPLPCVPNPNAIGRVHAVGNDAVRVKPGDLVYIDSTVRGRDDPNVMIMSGHIGGQLVAGKKLIQGEWRDGTLQQYHKSPLENVYPLNEERLCVELGYSTSMLAAIPFYAVAAGAILEAADVKVAETVVIGPSGGAFGGLAVEIALAIGANVIALGRSGAKLEAMKTKLGSPPQLKCVVMTGDIEADIAAILQQTPNSAGAEVYNDWTPAELKGPAPYLSAAVQVLKREGRVVLSGGSSADLPVPYVFVGMQDIQIKGKWMCSKKTIEQVIRMIEQGRLRIGFESGSELAEFTLNQHEKATEHARKHGGWRNYTVFVPNQG
ncbi:isopropanol dehydrogenase [Diaporthe amygdali]|uniref:isopropanol dehydrogenase n=1 Tax=Phomopsis amygdali TaxID=1214568 RepID=UPI0022FE266E|nr:isopropanol dehydrogenase [Diaporthe amygdali]KAJ0124019.1 isopropanol dehydrogenase [Diaporthe amygdali]